MGKYLALAQMFQNWITVTANNLCHFHIYLYLSLSFFSASTSYEPFLFHFNFYLSISSEADLREKPVIQMKSF